MTLGFCPRAKRYFRNAKKPSVFPLGQRNRPCQPFSGSTQPKRFNRLQCWLVVGTVGWLPRFAQTRPSLGCKEKPLSSAKTSKAFSPCSTIRWSFFSAHVENGQLLCCWPGHSDRPDASR